MKIRRIFISKKQGKLWAVCYRKRGDKWIDAFRELMILWNDTEYLFSYFSKAENQKKLTNPFWEGISVDEAIEMVLEQSFSLEAELYGIINALPGYENRLLSEIFKPLHDNIYSLNFENEAFRKAKPDFWKPIIRLYGLELDDGTIIVTGGAIKLTKPMENELLTDENEKLTKLKIYLRSEGVSDVIGLIG